MLDIGFRPAVETILKAVPRPAADPAPLGHDAAGRPRAGADLPRRPGRRPPDPRERGRDDPGDPAVVPDGRTPTGSSTCWSGCSSASSRTRAIVFCRTKRGADRVGDLLRAEGLPRRRDARQPQPGRSATGSSRRSASGRLTILVATDVVGRGIDVRGVSHVINFDLPDDPTHYVHRIGRTGRMGNDGVGLLARPARPGQAARPDRAVHLPRAGGRPGRGRPDARPARSSIARRPDRASAAAPRGRRRSPQRATSSYHGVRRRRDREAQGAGAPEAPRGSLNDR